MCLVDEVVTFVFFVLELVAVFVVELLLRFADVINAFETSV